MGSNGRRQILHATHLQSGTIAVDGNGASAEPTEIQATAKKAK